MIDILADVQSPPSAVIGNQDPVIPEWLRTSPPAMPRLRKMFDDARSSSHKMRMDAQRDRDYYDGPKQLNSEVRRTLNMRGQPAIYTNRIRPAIDGVMGVLDAAKVDPRAYPRNPDDDNAADVATKTLRYIADVNGFQETKLECAENHQIEGVCAAIVEVDGEDIKVNQIRYEEYFFDPFSRRHDFSDAKYMGIAKWMDASDVEAAYGQAYEAMGDPLSSAGIVDSTWEDRPDNFTPWVDRTRRRLMIVELYYVTAGEWRRCVFCAAGVFEHDVSPYLDDKKRPVCPIVATSCYVDRENARYGRVRDMIPIQDEINARRSRLLHQQNSRQIQEVSPGAAMVDADTARAEASKPDGVIPSGWQMVPTADLAAGAQLLLAEAKGEIERMGPTPAVLGRQGEAAQSGRARLVLQQAGMTELARPLGRLEDWENRCYRHMWHRAQQYWTGPMWIRVTDETRAPEFIQVNEPVMGEQMQPIAGPDGQPAIDPTTGAPQMQAVMGVVDQKNRLATMDMDIIIDTVPDTANLAAETFAEFRELVAAGIDPFGPQFELLVEMSPLPDKARVLERLKAKREELRQAQAQQAQQAAEAQQRMQALAENEANAKVDNIAASTIERGANAVKTQVETTLLAYKAGQESAQPPENEQAAAE